MSDLIIGGFDSQETAFLARAALAKLQGKLSLSWNDLLVATRETEGVINVCAPVDLISPAQEKQKTFWALLVDLLFATEPSSEGKDAATVKLAAIGIDETFLKPFSEYVRNAPSVLLVLIHDSIARDKVLGVLRGLHGKTVRSRLKGGSTDVWLHALSAPPVTTGK